jgi:hypothetical protein
VFDVGRQAMLAAAVPRAAPKRRGTPLDCVLTFSVYHNGAPMQNNKPWSLEHEPSHAVQSRDLSASSNDGRDLVEGKTVWEGEWPSKTCAHVPGIRTGMLLAGGMLPDKYKGGAARARLGGG